MSVVQNHRVMGSTTLPWGGEVVVEHCVQWLQKESDMMTTMMNEKDNINNNNNNPRAPSLLQWHARTAVHELSHQTRVNVHIPYMFADPNQHHLDVQLARPVLERVIDDHVPNLIDTSSLSPNLPPPTDLASWFTSAVTRVLEDSQVLPTHLKAWIIVGGASRIPLVQRSLQSTLHMLLGPMEMTVLPPFSTNNNNNTTSTTNSTAEWTVLGAATLAPSFGYSIPGGLTLHNKNNSNDDTS
jgi:molecular chaperone DnaK (HSP70)